MPGTPKLIGIACLLLVGLFLMTCEKDFSGLPKGNLALPPDTTSHHFVWTVDTFGTQSSVLYDVAIINENDIWAVGEIYTDDPYNPYNAIHWDGQKWTLKRLPTKTSYGAIKNSPIKAVFAFAENNVWMFSEAGSFVHYTGYQWRTEYITERQGGINKIWGSSASDLYFVGTNGNITYHDGQNWQKLDSGTDVDIKDIWGAKNETTGECEILAVASLQNYGREMDLLQINGSQISQLDTTGLHVNQSSIWFEYGRSYYVTGNGVFAKKNLIDSLWDSQIGHPLLYKDAIRGNSWNDVFVVGASGLVSHFNGNSWRHYNTGELPSFYGAYNAVAVKDDIVVAVGDINAVYGIILVGKRN